MIGEKELFKINEKIDKLATELANKEIAKLISSMEFNLSKNIEGASEEWGHRWACTIMECTKAAYITAKNEISSEEWNKMIYGNLK